MNGKDGLVILLLLTLGTTLLLACGTPTATVELPTATATTVEATAPTPQATSTPTPPSRVDIALSLVQRLEGEVLGTVNGEDITWEEYDLVLHQTLYTIERQSPVDWSDPAMKQRLTHLQNEVLRQTADRLLLRQMASRMGIEVDAAELAARVQAEKQTALAGGAYGSWEEFLQRYGLTDQTFEQVIHDSLLFSALIVNQQVETQSEHVHMAHLVVDDPEVAQEAYQKLVDGADWSETVAEYSQDTETSSTGGDLGWFSRTALVAELAGPAFELEVGAFSAPIDTEHGHTIIKVLERAIRDDDELTIRRRQQEALQAFLEAERANATIEYLVDFEAEAQPQ
jgi:parvulin-like peptidyl-prolyl isomerase